MLFDRSDSSDMPQERRDLYGLMVFSGIEVTGAFMGAVENMPLNGLTIMGIDVLVVGAIAQGPAGH